MILYKFYFCSLQFISSLSERVEIFLGENNENFFASSIALILSTGALIASDFRGIIDGIDNANKTIQVNRNTIKVMPYTKIKQESCGIGWDSARKFVDLKQGDVVKINLAKNSAEMIAEKIKIKCVKNPAY